MQYCGRCHGNVGRSSATTETFLAIVQKGLLTANGMSNFGNRLTDKDVIDLRSYILTIAGEKLKKGGN